MGYQSWRRSILRSLSVKNKLGFVTGDCKKPAANSPQLRLWQRCDDMVTSWILNSLAKEIADSVEYVNDSVELWKELEDRYDQANGAKLYQLQKEINDLNQGVLDITSYYTKMKKLWEELNNLIAKSQCTCACVCGAKDSTHKAEHDRRLIQKRNKESSSNPRNFKTNYSTGNGNSNKGNLICEYCKRPGHTVSKCYKLHGYPPDNCNDPKELTLVNKRGSGARNGIPRAPLDSGEAPSAFRVFEPKVSFLMPYRIPGQGDLEFKF
ncbi:hypothetical protein KY290_020593 [Solanum tuberosum]|uniref:Retrotransposon Copia-like N-terminal domain-containing protein n=1 Tax=Solanum tuberosum TaxID=4113 RepID=A0ABQ7UZ36_SOLTU|nr:hypothetical protein KY290_020593 [Solanum tuberosum]